MGSSCRRVVTLECIRKQYSEDLKHKENRNYFPLLPPEVLVKLQSAKKHRVAKLQTKFTAISTASKEEPTSKRSDCPASGKGRCVSLSALIG